MILGKREKWCIRSLFKERKQTNPPIFVPSGGMDGSMNDSSRKKSKAKVYFKCRSYLGSEIMLFLRVCLSFGSSVKERSVKSHAG